MSAGKDKVAKGTQTTVSCHSTLQFRTFSFLKKRIVISVFLNIVANKASRHQWQEHLVRSSAMPAASGRTKVNKNGKHERIHVSLNTENQWDMLSLFLLLCCFVAYYLSSLLKQVLELLYSFPTGTVGYNIWHCDVCEAKWGLQNVFFIKVFLKHATVTIMFPLCFFLLCWVINVFLLLMYGHVHLSVADS